MTRFERATLCSQSRCATKLRHIPFRVVEADAGLVPAEGIEPTHPKERIYSPPRLASAPCRHGDLVVSYVPSRRSPPSQNATIHHGEP